MRTALIAASHGPGAVPTPEDGRDSDACGGAVREDSPPDDEGRHVEQDVEDNADLDG
jgi:hypothetical protein